MGIVGNVCPNVCPTTKETWETRAEAKKYDCGGQSVYHCLSDSEGRIWEKCVQRTLVIPGYCPMFTDAGFIDWKSYNTSDPSCPNSSYVSNEVYKYPGCFGSNNVKEGTYCSGVEQASVGVFFGYIFVILFIIGAALTSIFRKKIKSKSRNSSTENDHYVLSGRATLSRQGTKSIVVLRPFGTSISETSLHILREFKAAEKVEWRSMEQHFTTIPNRVDDYTIMIIYGWFGSWNDDQCSLDAVKNACYTLVEILKNTRNVKLIIDMRSDLYKRYEQKLEEYATLFCHEIYLDHANLQKEAEHKKKLEEKIINPCENPECACNKLTLEIMQSDKTKSRIIGMPLIINILANFHDLIPSYLDNSDIFGDMMNHISTLEKDKKRIYEWIAYICLKGKFTHSTPYDKELIEKMGFQICDCPFEECFNDLSRYLKKQSTNPQKQTLSDSSEFEYVLCPFIYICTFHLLYTKDPNAVITLCNIDAVLQLVRPVGIKLSCVEVSADRQRTDLFKKRMFELGLHKRYKDHSLYKPILASTV